MKPNQKIIDVQESQGFSFLRTVDPEFEARYETEKDDSFDYMLVALKCSLSQGEIMTKYAKKLGVQPDRLKVIMDAYKYEQLDLPLVSPQGEPDEYQLLVVENLRRKAALFVRTEDLERILRENKF